jgi:hypothetical protein
VVVPDVALQPREEHHEELVRVLLAVASHVVGVLPY